jgi:hypothetical protein
VETIKWKVKHTDTGDDHFKSTILFIILEITFEYQAPQTYNLLVRVSPEDPIYRKFFDTNVLFHNEIHMYTEVIPFVEDFLKKR